MNHLGKSIRFTVEQHAKTPEYKTPGSAGADLYAYLPEDDSLVIPSGCVGIIPTGLKVEIPSGYEIQIRPRSGLAAKFGVTVLNSPGTIDSDYRGEIMIILINHGNDQFIVHHEDRIAQMVVSPVVQLPFNIADTLSDTERGSGGFGSTGI